MRNIIILIVRAELSNLDQLIVRSYKNKLYFIVDINENVGIMLNFILNLILLASIFLFS